MILDFLQANSDILLFLCVLIPCMIACMIAANCEDEVTEEESEKLSEYLDELRKLRHSSLKKDKDLS